MVIRIYSEKESDFPLFEVIFGYLKILLGIIGSMIGALGIGR